MKTLGKIITVVLILLTLTTLMSCSKKTNVLVVGVSAEYPPFEYKEGADFKGIDIEIAKLVAQKLGMELQLQDMEFDSLIPSLTSNKIDLAISAITITPERKEQIDFSDSYYKSNQTVLVKKESPVVVNTEADLTNFVIGAQNGTTGQLYLSNNFVKTGKMDEKKLKKYSTNIEAVTDLLNGNIDMVIMDEPAANGYARVKDVKLVYTIQTNEEFGIALPKNSPLKDKINQALKEILASDDWNKIINDYLVK
jgi:polar amino acid transport system substrate-binding protein